MSIISKKMEDLRLYARDQNEFDNLSKEVDHRSKVMKRVEAIDQVRTELAGGILKYTCQNNDC